jgi:hypothetical protein
MLSLAPEEILLSAVPASRSDPCAKLFQGQPDLAARVVFPHCGFYALVDCAGLWDA